MAGIEESLFHRALSRIVLDRGLEAEWLNLLSQLEHIGCRKIIKAVPYPAMSLSILRHVSEEASHACLLKAAAERLGEGISSWDRSPLGEMGWTYFRALDERITGVTKDTKWNYPGVSWAVERRVLEVYPWYLKLTRDDYVRQTLARILAEEKRHGAEINAMEFGPRLKDLMRSIEGELWSGFERALNQWVESKTPAVHS